VVATTKLGGPNDDANEHDDKGLAEKKILEASWY